MSEHLAFEKNNLYRDHYRRALKFVVMLSVSAVILTAVLAYQCLRTPTLKYYATTTEGRVIPLYSLSQPVITNSYLLQWASLAARGAFNLDFTHYQAQMAQAKPYFTSDGWQKFSAAMKSSGLLDTVINKKLIMSAVVAKAPVILFRGVVQGRFTWRIQLPLLVNFESASENSSAQHWLVTMNIQRVPTLTAPKGIEISDFAVTPHND